MAVTSPNISGATSSVYTQRDTEQGRLDTNRTTDLNRILTQAGLSADQIAAIEGIAYGADQTVLGNNRAVADRNQAGRVTTLNRDNEERIRNQGTADRAALQARSDAGSRADREQSAIDAVNAAYAGYDQNFFDNYASGIVNAGLPQIRDTYKEKGRVTNATLSQRGIGQSSAAARIVGRLRGAQAGEEAALAQEASDSAEALRGRLDAARNDAIRTALAAANIQQDTPVAGATIGDILAARRAAGAGSGAPGLPASPAPLSAAPGTTGAKPGYTATQPPGGGQQGGGQQGGGQQGGGSQGDGPVLGDQDGDGKPDTIFNSDPKGGQISGVEYEGGPWVYAHQPGSEGYDAFARGEAGGTGQQTPIQIPTITYPASAGARRQSQSLTVPTANLSDAGLQPQLQPPPSSVGDTTALPPQVDTMRVRRRAPGQPITGPQVDTMKVTKPAGPQTTPTNLATVGMASNVADLPEALGGTKKAADWQRDNTNYANASMAGFGPNTPAALGGMG